MTQLTKEEWLAVAERLGESASGLGEIADKYGSHVMDSSWRQTIEDLRMAAAAVLWVSEHAADRVRFVMLDGHPTDEV